MMLTQQEAAARVEVCGSRVAAANRKAVRSWTSVSSWCTKLPPNSPSAPNHQPGEKRPPDT